MTHVRKHRIAMLFCLVGATGLGATSVHAHDLVTMTFESEAVGRTMAYDVLLPSDYETSQTRYPVLYLLHGHGGHHRVWKLLDALDTQPATDSESTAGPAWPDDLIIVMPDAGNSWYVNWEDDNRDEAGDPIRSVRGTTDQRADNWEDYIVVDLIDHVDRTFRTIPERAGRAIGGFSMGGYGAIMLGLRNAERFVSIASISGYLDYARSAQRGLESGPRAAPRRRPRPATVDQALEAARAKPNPTIAVEGFRSRIERTPRGRAFATVDNARAHDPFALVGALVDPATHQRLPHLHLACGTEDALFGFTRELAEALLRGRIPFGYWQASGKHDAAFRSQALSYLVPRLHKEMTHAVRAQSPTRHEHAPKETFLERWRRIRLQAPSGTALPTRPEVGATEAAVRSSRSPPIASTPSATCPRSSRR